MSNTNPFFSGFFSRFFWNVGGRIDRRQYWTFFLIMMAYAIALITTIIIGKELGVDRDFLFAMLVAGYIPVIWTGVVVSIKRIRDTGASPWFYLLQLVPYLGLIIALVFAALPTNYFHRFRKEAKVEVVTA